MVYGFISTSSQYVNFLTAIRKDLIEKDFFQRAYISLANM